MHIATNIAQEKEIWCNVHGLLVPGSTIFFIMDNWLADSCLLTHAKDTEQH